VIAKGIEQLTNLLKHRRTLDVGRWRRLSSNMRTTFVRKY
jgi:hypothetical protein